jgi:hypothetical protein
MRCMRASLALLAFKALWSDVVLKALWGDAVSNPRNPR